MMGRVKVPSMSNKLFDLDKLPSMSKLPNSRKFAKIKRNRPALEVEERICAYCQKPYPFCFNPGGYAYDTQYCSYEHASLDGLDYETLRKRIPKIRIFTRMLKKLPQKAVRELLWLSRGDFRRLCLLHGVEPEDT